MKSIKIELIVIFLILNSSFVKSQNIIESRRSSYWSNIYKIDPKYSEHFENSKVNFIKNEYLTNKIDSFPSDSVYNKILPTGNYLMERVVGNRIIYYYTTVPAFEVYIVVNYTDFIVKIFDTNGVLMNDAQVFLNKKKIKFDKKTQSYVIKKTNRKGTLKVIYNNQTFFYSVNKKYKHNFRNYILLPVRVTWSVVRHPLYYLQKYFRKIENLFIEKDYKYYLVFNKPKYRLGDTVMFKAYITNKKGKPVNKALSIFLINENYNQTKIIDTIKPTFNKGAYSYKFVIDKSLKMNYDKTYHIHLNDEKRTIASGTFRYEDYELKYCDFSFRILTDVHFFPNINCIFLQAKDQNGFNVPEVKARIQIDYISFSDIFQNNFFFPLIMWEKEIKLDNIGETKIEIPQKIIPQANIKYNVTVEMWTPENEYFRKSLSVYYYYKKNEIKTRYVNDSIEFYYTFNNVEKRICGNLCQNDVFNSQKIIPINKQLETVKVQLPYKIKINQYVKNYTFYNDSINVEISPNEPPFQVLAYKDKNNVNIKVLNPHRINFQYYIYKGNREITRGYSNTLDFVKKDKSDMSYYVFVSYLWNGKIKEYKLAANSYKTNINVDVNIPQDVYPGQNTQISMKVTDFKGKPVKYADVTAYCIKSNFKANSPSIPYFAIKTKGNKRTINSFSISKKTSNEEFQYLLGYRFRNFLEVYGLDTIEFYKFLYPKNIYFSTINIEPDKTEFAPFVVKNGEIQPISYILVDNEPVYFAWSNNEPYSFAIKDNNKHNLTIRTREYLLNVTNISFSKGKKTIFSFNVPELLKDYGYYQDKFITVNCRKIGEDYSYDEQKMIKKYTLPYVINAQTNIYIKQNSRYYVLNNYAGNKSKRSLTRPILNDSVFVKYPFVFSKKYPFVRYYEHTFEPQLLILQQNFSNELYPKQAERFMNVVFYDRPIDTQFIDKMNKYEIMSKRLNMSYCPIYDNNGLKNLNGIIETNNDKKLLSIFLFNKKNFYFQSANNLKININFNYGQNYLLLLYEDGFYQLWDSIILQPNGVNYYKIIASKDFSRNQTSIELDSLLNDLAINNSKKSYKDEAILNYLAKFIKQKDFSFSLDQNKDLSKNQSINNKQNYIFTRVLKGRVFDNNYEPIPGAVVKVKDFNVATLTDLDGYFTLKIPQNAEYLVVSFIGKETIEVSINDDLMKIVLFPEEVLLQCVVVTGHPTNRVVKQIAYSISSGTVNEIDISSINEKEKIEFEKTEKQKKEEEQKKLKVDTNLMVSSLRSRFSDYAFWQPELMTDKNGEVKFNVHFPDDVTKWISYFLVFSKYKQTAMVQKNIRSYKPLLSQISLPNFLVAGDTVLSIGKTTTYLYDSINFITKFYVDDSLKWAKNQKTDFSVIDTLGFVATNSDSMKIKYIVETDDYFDGEQRNIGINPIGLQINEGVFRTINKNNIDTIFQHNFPKFVKITAYSTPIDIIYEELERVKNYNHYCNEQLASKLMAFLLNKKLARFYEKNFQYQDEIIKIIKLLVERQEKNGLWGWWQGMDVSFWISNSVLKALLLAKEEGYDIGIELNPLTSSLIWCYNNTVGTEKIRILQTIQLLNDTNFQIEPFINQLDTMFTDLTSQILITQLKQKAGMKYSLDSIWAYVDTTIFGNYYINNQKQKNKYYSVYDNERLLTIEAYIVLKNANTNEEILSKFRNYFIELKQRYLYWFNTFETIRISETLLPDFMKIASLNEKQKIDFWGGYNKTVDRFPFRDTLNFTEDIYFKKQGAFPVYLSVYYDKWLVEPTKNSEYFDIKTKFLNGNYLKAGIPTFLEVIINVKKECEYIAIEIPIPAGCSYNSKIKNYDCHTEYYKDKVCVYYTKLKPGEFTIKINLLPRYTGIYTLNPTKAELMYFPIFYGNNEVRKVKIIENQ